MPADRLWGMPANGEYQALLLCLQHLKARHRAGQLIVVPQLLLPLARATAKPRLRVRAPKGRESLLQRSLRGLLGPQTNLR